MIVALVPVRPVRADSAGRSDETGEASDPPAAGPPAPELAPIIINADQQQEPALVERSFDTSEDVAGFGETILAEPLWRGFESTAELLGQSVGAQIRRQGGRDDFATLSIRGAPSGQVRILLDGISLGRASDSVVNLADLPLDTVERIEVYRGFAPAGLTPASAAGVVNVITRDPKHATATAAAGGGSFGTAKVNAGGAGPVLGGNASAFASYRTTDGDFDFVDDNGTINNSADDLVRKRANNDSDAVESLVRWRRDLAETAKLQLRNHIFYKEEGVPGLARFAATPKSRLETTREIAALALGGTDGHWNIEEGVTWRSQQLTDTAAGAFDNSGETTASTTTARWGRPLGQSNWFSGSSEYTWEDFRQHSRGAAAPDQQATRSSLAAAVGDDWTIDALKATLSFQLRHQQLWNEDKTPVTGAGKDTDHSTDPRVGLRWEPVSGVAIKSNVSSYFRPPTFDELYGTTGFTTGNPGLRAESGIAWDAGFEWTGERDPFGALALGYAYFGSNIDDVILVLLTVDRSAKAQNAERAAIRGHETRIEWQGPAGLALSANFTLQDAENRSDTFGLVGKDLAGVPPKEGYARLSWSRGLFVFAYDIEVTGKHYADSMNVERRLPTRTVQGLSVVIGPLWKNLRLTLEADNIGNSLVPDQVGFPLPGRSFYATLSWSAAPTEKVADAK